MRALLDIDPSLFKARKLERKLTRRKLRDLKQLADSKDHESQLERTFGRKSQIVEMLSRVTPADKPGLKKRGFGLLLPPVFSMLDEPERALACLADFAKATLAERLGAVSINYEKVTQQDLGANALLDIIVDELTTQARRTRRRIRWKGSYPKDPALKRFVKAMGVIKRLKIEHEYPDTTEVAQLKLFDRRCKHYIRALKGRQLDQKSSVTAKFADHVNECLRTIGKELTPSARGQLCSYVGELLGNAEEHSGLLDWTIQGYLDTQVAAPMCEIVIFNFGRTIAETFQRLPRDSFTHQQVKTYLDTHSQRHLFSAGWRHEDLFTLIALQGNVSSKNHTPQDTRGNGTVDLIEFFQRVHAECAATKDAQATMSLISGSTVIFFDGRYQMRPNENGIKVIAFNDDNNLLQRPNSNCVRQLRGASFPGTLISLKFPLSVAKSTIPMEGTINELKND